MKGVLTELEPGIVFYFSFLDNFKIYSHMVYSFFFIFNHILYSPYFPDLDLLGIQLLQNLTPIKHLLKYS